MSKLSSYANDWLEFIFEGNNKKNSPFQVRRKKDEARLLALCLILFFVASVFSISIFVSHLNPTYNPKLADSGFEFSTIHFNNFKLSEPQKPVQFMLPPTVKRPTEFIKKSLQHPKILKIADCNSSSATTQLP